MIKKTILLISVMSLMILPLSTGPSNAACLPWGKVRQLNLKPSSSSVTARFNRQKQGRVINICATKSGSGYAYLVKILRKNGKIIVSRVRASR